MAECPLPKPNTRVRFPSPAPKKERLHLELFFFWNRFRVLRNRAHASRAAANLQSKFALRLLAIEAWF